MAQRKAFGSVSLEFLDDARDPLLLASESGDIEWTNGAADQLLTRLADRPAGRGERKAALDQIFGSDLARKILSTSGVWHEIIELRLAVLGAVPHQLVALDVSGIDPGQQSVLVALQPPLGSPAAATPDDLLATVAHDLKNPLAAVFGYADALLDTPTGAGLTDRQREVIGRIRGTAARCIDLVKNYQHLGELSTHGLYAPASGVDLSSVVQGVIDGTWREDPHRVTLALRLAAEPLVVRVDRVYLDRIISNLFSNALKFTPPAGTITVSTRREGEKAVFEVHNTGTYIAEHERREIFSRYARGSAGQSVPGSGLGLYIVDRITTLAGGTIEVLSSKERGTSFVVRLPVTA